MVQPHFDDFRAVIAKLGHDVHPRRDFEDDVCFEHTRVSFKPAHPIVDREREHADGVDVPMVCAFDRSSEASGEYRHLRIGWKRGVAVFAGGGLEGRVHRSERVSEPPFDVRRSVLGSVHTSEVIGALYEPCAMRIA